MKNILTNSTKLLLLGAVLSIGLSFIQVGDPTKDPMVWPCDPPKVKATRDFRYKFFPGFVELRTNNFSINAKVGEVTLVNSPRVALINIDIISKVIEWGGRKEGYSTLVYTKGKEEPILVLQSYKDVCEAVRKAAEANVGS